MEETQLASTQGAGGSPSRDRSPSLAPGTTLGRYLILEHLGAGMMGVVFAAYDPQLDRKVAVKLLKPRGRDREDGGARLQREARALAKLAHPNVVAVHDVGEYESQMFVAMEFVAGMTLSEWLETEPRGVDDILEVFRSAGLGLMAAHDVGLVHRDFKPDNVMIGSDGRVRVMDFGLARAEGDDGEDTAPTHEPGSSPANEMSARLTRTGALIGTPAYMAAEQFAGRRGDAKSDQFSFCVALWEALYGQRPFAGDTHATLTYAVINKQLREVPSNSQVPARVHKVLIRGLSPEASERFESIDALLDAIAPPKRTHTAWWVAGLVALTAATGLGYGFARTNDGARPCEDMGDPLTGVWGPEQRSTIEASFRAIETSFAVETWPRVEGRIDAWAERWAEQRQDACEATLVRKEQSDEAMDLRMRCLDSSLEALVTTVEVLSNVDAAVVSEAVTLVERLPSADRCADLDRLRARLPAPDDSQLAARVDELEGMLARSRALGFAAKPDEQLALATETEEEARLLDHPPIRIQALLELGIAQFAAGRYEEAEQNLIEAYRQALGHRMIDEAASASSSLVLLLCYELNRPEDALDWGIHGLALAEASTDPIAEATFSNALGGAHWVSGDLEAADEVYRRAAEQTEEALGADSHRLAAVLANHSRVLNVLGRRDDARAQAERALSVFQSSLGPRHPDVAMGHNTLAQAAYYEGRLEDARQGFERALAITEGAFGPHHRDLMLSVGGLGLVATEQGRLDDARAFHTRAADILGRNLGFDHPEHARMLANLGEVMLDQKDWDDALATLQRSLEILEPATSSTNLQLAIPLTGIGRALVALDRPEDAIASLERAVSLRAERASPSRLAHSKFHLARALWEANPPARDRTRALTLAREAHESDPDLDQSSAEWTLD